MATIATPHAFLLDRTGKDAAYWVGRIEALIRAHSKKVKPTDAHPQTNTARVLERLVREIMEGVPLDRPIDGNMYVASVLGFVLTLWYTRLAHAKACDPVRPLSLRRSAYHMWLEFCAALTRATYDASKDPTYFPGQSWQSPFDPEATSGDFV